MNRLKADIQNVVEQKELFEPYANSAVLITGATGFIGAMLMRTIAAANKKYELNTKVFGQIRSLEKAKTVLADVINDIELTTTDDVKVDYIVHTVSPTKSKFFIEHPVETIKVSIESTISILEAAKRNNAKMVYLSSMEQYGVPYEPGQRMTEEKVGVIDHLNIRSSYSESKRLCECLCASYAAEYDVDVKIARLAQTVGAGAPLADNRMPMQFAKAVVEEKDIVLHTRGKSLSNFVYITDAITGILTILNNGEKGNAYNVCNDKETRSVLQIAELVCNSIADSRISVRIDEIENMGYAPAVAMYMDSCKLQNLGWNAKINVKEGYGRLVEWIQMNKG